MIECNFTFEMIENKDTEKHLFHSLLETFEEGVDVIRLNLDYGNSILSGVLKKENFYNSDRYKEYLAESK